MRGLLVAVGPQRYTGAESAPTFQLGNFALTESRDGVGRYTLTISAVSAAPEPATFALLLGGLVVGGAAVARRRGAENVVVDTALCPT